MTTQERYKKYVEEVCIKCSNREKNLCKITIREGNNNIEAGCDYYEPKRK